jgi:hypothetical protein
VKLSAGSGVRGVTVKQPLSRVIGIRFWESVRISLDRNLQPVREVERNLYKGGVCYFECLIYSSDGSVEFR